MNAIHKKNGHKANGHDNKGQNKHAKFSERAQRDKHCKSRRFSREDKRVLKKRIVKILSRKGQVNFDKLLHKLDIAPSVLSKVLAKLERKGVASHIDKGHGHNHCGHQGDAHHKISHHAENRHGIRKTERFARCHKSRHGEKGRQWGGSCRFALNSAF
jgi:ribosomal protein S25